LTIWVDFRTDFFFWFFDLPLFIFFPIIFCCRKIVIVIIIYLFSINTCHYPSFLIIVIITYNKCLFISICCWSIIVNRKSSPCLCPCWNSWWGQICLGGHVILFMS
jgi:hypothetical protein